MRWVWNTSWTVWALAAEQAVDVAAGVDAARQHVVVGAPHGELGAGLDRGQRIGDRRQHVVADLDELGAAARACWRVSATTIASTSPAYDVRPPTGIMTGQSL